MQIPLVWIYFIIGMLAGITFAGLIGYIYFQVKYSEVKDQAVQQLSEKEIQIDRLTEQNDSLIEQLEEVKQLLDNERIRNATLSERVNYLGSFEEIAASLEAKTVLLQEKNVELEKEVSELTTRLEEERKSAQNSIKELKEAKEIMQNEFKLLASQIMERNSERFSNISKERVEEVLKPLQQQVNDFKKRVEEVHTQETKEMATLLNEIKTLKELNNRISEDALNLTRALKGESKQQGIWGEMVLERVLEASGLREGEEFEREVSLQDGDSKRFRPDVIVHLPDDRDIIIDAKTSLVAYEQYINAEDEEKKAHYAKLHIEAVKSHIDKLSDKSYTMLEGVNTLDFIFMFMPIEGALMLALQTDQTLYDKAFAKHIVLVSPTTLLVALRAVENTWRHERQNQNAMEIARKAGALYDKFVGFAEDLEKVGKQLDTVQKTYDSAWKKLTDGRGNIVRRIEELHELGARASKKIPKKLSDAAGADISVIEE